MALLKNKLQSFRLSKYVEQLWLKKDQSDVIFSVEGQQLPAHRLILASRDYFRALLLGNYVESSKKVVELKNIRFAPFKALLKYIYYDFIILDEMNVAENIEILQLAHMYDFIELTAAIEQYLTGMISITTVASVLKVAQELSLKSLMENCLKFLDENATIFLKHSSFIDLSQESVRLLLKRNTFAADEINIFKALQNWLLKNDCRDQIMFKLIRFPLMSIEDLVNVVQPSGVLPDDIIFNNIREKLLISKKASSLSNGEELLNKNSYNGGTLCNDPKSKFGIIVKLRSARLINHIQLLLASSYKYYVEVSVDQKQWVRVADNTQFESRSHQNIYFESRKVQYIRLVGTLSKLLVDSLKVFHIDEVKWNGFVVPSYNIATYDCGAIVTNGKNGTGLLHSTYTMNPGENDSDRKDFTSHSIGNDENILIQFGQPYYVESLRLKLWKEENHVYSFYIQTSTDLNNWEMAVDMTNTKTVKSSSSPVYKFAKRLVVFIRIVGTYSSTSTIKGGEEFRCVRFECPAIRAVETLERKLPVIVEKPKQHILTKPIPIRTANTYIDHSTSRSSTRIMDNNNIYVIDN